MKINDRPTLDTTLKDPKNSYLLLFGKQNALAQSIEALSATAINKPTRVTILIEDVTILKGGPDLKDLSAWYKADDQYTTLAPLDDPKADRKVVEQKGLQTLCKPAGKPSSRLLQLAFDRADAA